MDYEVTIGIPVYNVERYIRQAMDSVMAQTFESIEILICDDCGTDSSIDIVRDYQSNHPRGKDIRILRQPHNMGIGAGRNLMMDEALGKFFYSMDADDTIEPNTIELLYNTAQKHDAQIVYGSFDRVYTTNDKVVKTVPYPYPSHVFIDSDEYAYYVYHVGIQGMNWNYLISMDVIRKNQLKVTPVRHGYGEDFTFTIDLPTYVDRAVLLPDITYHYYIRGVDKHLQRKSLRREDMMMAVNALETKKNRQELKGKPYYAKRISRLMMLCCSFACEMIVKRSDFDKSFSNREIRRVMHHPMSLREILSLEEKAGRFHNLLYWTIGTVPSWMSVWLLRLMIKRYGMK